MIENIFLELSYIVIITAILAGVMRFLRQPLIIAYIAAGIIVSPHVLDLVKSQDAVATFSQMGIAFLLFMVGLNLSPKIIRDVGKISLITGVGQVVFTSLIGYFIAKVFGFGTIESLYIAVALTFSSTIVIMKLLSDKKDLESLYGRISVGFLIVQDIIAMMILIFISSIPSSEKTIELVIESIIKGSGLIAVTLLIGQRILPALTKKIAGQQEFLILFSIAWCFALATVCYLLGFSIEIGALLAGISLSFSPFRHEIAHRVKPLRDFFLIMFFVFLGTQMQFGEINGYTAPILIFSLFILIGNPLIVMILMGMMGYTARTGFLAGLTVAQISEFSLILIALGVKMGHLSPDMLSFVTIIGLITIAGSTYFIMYGKKIYHALAKYLKIFEKKTRKVDENIFGGEKIYDILFVGYENLAKHLLKTSSEWNTKSLVIDYNPEIIATLKNIGVDAHFADVEDPDIFEHINIEKVKMVISSVKSSEINLQIIHKIRKRNPDCIIIVVSESADFSEKLYRQGASYVITSDYLSSDHTLAMIKKHGFNQKKFLQEKIDHLEKLQNTL